MSLSFAIAQLYCFWPFIWDHKCATFISSCRADIYFGVSVCVNAGKLALKVHRGYEGEKNVIGLSVKLYKIFSDVSESVLLDSSLIMYVGM